MTAPNAGDNALKVIFILGLLTLVLGGLAIILSACASVSTKDGYRRTLGQGLVWCLQAAGYDQMRRDQCHSNFEFECIEHGLPKQCAEDTALTTVGGTR